MSKLKIYKFPDLVLAQKASPIQRVEKSYWRLADDMLETMYDSPGVGLAANQVGILERILVLDTDYELEELKEGQKPPEGAEVFGTSVIHHRTPRILINPEIINREGTTAFEEGCLSVPDFTAEVKRSEKLEVRYQDVDGLTKTLKADGLLAIAIQHEIDHLDGRLFIDRLSPLKKDLVKKRLRQERMTRENSPEAELALAKKKTKGI